MTPEEMVAKRQWGTDNCQAPRCAGRAAYLVLETGPDHTGPGEWWQYCCRRHAARFAGQHGLTLPTQPASPARRVM